MESCLLARRMKSPLSFLFRCDGSAKIGLGHVRRCLALAHELRRTYHANATFAIRKAPEAIWIVRQNGYAVHQPPSDANFNYTQWLAEIGVRTQPNALILDVRDDLPISGLQDLKEQGILIATIDDPSDRRLAADGAYSPEAPQVHRLDWDSFTSQLHV